jgi:hypothetical protein
MLVGLLCACICLLVPAAALASTGSCLSGSSDAVAQSAAEQVQTDIHVADRPELDGLSGKHLSKKPRRNNRRPRVRGGDRLQVASYAGWSARTPDQMQFQSKRHRGKRSLMRRLMTVRGGLQA